MFFFKIDNYLIDHRFEPFAHKFQRLTGKTNFWLAKVSWVILVLSALSVMGSAAYVFGPVLALCLVLIFKKLTATEKEFFAEQSNHMNDLRISMLQSRASGLMVFCPTYLFIFLLSGHLEWIFISFTTLSGPYFAACTPLPPGTSKFRQWVNKMLWKVSDSLNPRPEPAPTL